MKYFEEPMICVTVFAVEDIVTVSDRDNMGDWVVGEIPEIS